MVCLVNVRYKTEKGFSGLESQLSRCYNAVSVTVHPEESNCFNSINN